MEIAGSSLSMTARHSLVSAYERSERLRAWVGDTPPARSDAVEREPPQAGPGGWADPEVERKARQATYLRQGVQAAQAAKAETAGFDPVPSDAEIDKVLLLLEKLFGVKPLKRLDLQGDPSAARAAQAVTASAQDAAAALGRPGGGGQPQRAGWGVDYELHERSYEREESSLSITGTFEAVDGRRFAVALTYSQVRERVSTHDVQFRAGDAVRPIDPLMLNLGGGAVTLDPARTVAVDLDGDGRQDRVAAPGAGTWMLVRDRDGDGAVDGGQELFGPVSGSGFGELAALDQDGNGFVDGGDAAFSQLFLWNGGSLLALGQAGVGALATASVELPFAHQDGDGALLGQQTRGGLFLKEDGTAGALQQVDLVAS